MRRSSEQLLLEGVRNVQDLYPGHIEDVLRRRNDPNGEACRWYQPQTLAGLLERKWVKYTDPEGLIPLPNNTLALVTDLPGYVGIERLADLPPETELWLRADDKGQLYAVLNAMPKVSSPFTVALLESINRYVSVYNCPVLSTFVVGRPVHRSCILVHGDNHGIRDGALASVLQLLGRGVTHYKIGAFPKGLVLHNSDWGDMVYEGQVRAYIEMVTEPMQIASQNLEEAQDHLVRMVRETKGITWKFESRDGKCPIFDASSPTVRFGDVRFLRAISPRVGVMFTDRNLTQPGAVQRRVRCGTVSNPDF